MTHQRGHILSRLSTRRAAHTFKRRSVARTSGFVGVLRLTERRSVRRVRAGEWLYFRGLVIRRLQYDCRQLSHPRRTLKGCAQQSCCSCCSYFSSMRTDEGSDYAFLQVHRQIQFWDISACCDVQSTRTSCISNGGRPMVCQHRSLRSRSHICTHRRRHLPEHLWEVYYRAE